MREESIRRARPAFTPMIPKFREIPQENRDKTCTSVPSEMVDTLGAGWRMIENKKGPVNSPDPFAFTLPQTIFYISPAIEARA